MKLLYKRINRLKFLAFKYKRSEVVQNTLLEISNLAATVKCAEEFYSGMQNSLNKLLPADNFFIALLNPTTQELYIPFFVDEKAPHPQVLYPSENLSNTLYSGLTGYVLKQKQPLLCDDDVFQQLLTENQIVSRGAECHQWLGVPILSELTKPYELAKQYFTSGASIGIAFSGQYQNDSSESLLRSADAAMYQAKSNGEGSYVIFDKQTRQQQNHNFMLETELRDALSQQQLALQYFPVMQLDSEQIIAFEPRLYWQHSKLGKIKQLQLNNIAEHCNLIKELDLYLFEQLNRDHPKLTGLIEYSASLSHFQRSLQT